MSLDVHERRKGHVAVLATVVDWIIYDEGEIDEDRFELVKMQIAIREPSADREFITAITWDHTMALVARYGAERRRRANADQN